MFFDVASLTQSIKDQGLKTVDLSNQLILENSVIPFKENEEGEGHPNRQIVQLMSSLYDRSGGLRAVVATNAQTIESFPLNNEAGLFWEWPETKPDQADDANFILSPIWDFHYFAAAQGKTIKFFTLDMGYRVSEEPLLTNSEVSALVKMDNGPLIVGLRSGLILLTNVKDSVKKCVEFGSHTQAISHILILDKEAFITVSGHGAKCAVKLWHINEPFKATKFQASELSRRESIDIGGSFRGRIKSSTRNAAFNTFAVLVSKSLLAITSPEGILIWDIDGGKYKHTLPALNVINLVSLDNGLLLSCTEDEVSVWEVNTASLLTKYKGSYAHLMSCGYGHQFIYTHQNKPLACTIKTLSAKSIESLLTLLSENDYGIEHLNFSGIKSWTDEHIKKLIFIIEKHKGSLKTVNLNNTEIKQEIIVKLGNLRQGASSLVVSSSIYLDADQKTHSNSSSSGTSSYPSSISLNQLDMEDDKDIEKEKGNKAKKSCCLMF